MEEHAPLIDRTPALLLKGYTWLPDLFRDGGGAPAVRTRLLGREAVALRGPDAVRFVYDDANVRRAGALPEPVLSTLIGHGAVQTLDGEEHRVRKALFSGLLHSRSGLDELVRRCTEAWRGAAEGPGRGSSFTVFDEAALALARGAGAWAGVPLTPPLERGLARDLVAMVDAFATAGPRHWRGRRARGLWERRLARLVEEVRDGALPAPPGSAVAAVAAHRDRDGSLLAPRTAAVELLNILRPTVATCWYTAFAAHALARWPHHRERLRDAPGGFAPAFAQEVRRFYPFAPFIGGIARADRVWRGVRVPEGALVLLDLYGQNRDPRLWSAPHSFDPDRFLHGPVDPDVLVPQGGGDERTGHRCPGEDVVAALLGALSAELGRIRYEVPDQDMRIPLHRIPTRPRSGMVISGVR
ncbi:cytochrome P450 [Nocardiopsis potens]|uniref:cytochrome P450 n=1 Tax=Nocardiopsis potens TaxID=1246458 RepID=UPI00034C9072|nr:cytochrome P450 [Nocardiopsis potens]